MYSVSGDLFGSSNTTSEAFAVWDARVWTVSAYTSAGTTSALTLQLSNYSGVDPDKAPVASWSNYTVFTPSAATVLFGPSGVRFARLLKGAKGTFVVSYNKSDIDS